jgi:hypothetical protein
VDRAASFNDGIKLYTATTTMLNATAFLSSAVSPTMSRQQGHRESHSTSALNVLASPSTHHQSTLAQSIASPTPTPTPATPRSRRAQGSSISRLGSVVEDDSERDEHSHSRSHMREESRDGVEGLLGMISSRTPRKERTPHEKGKSSDGLGLEELRAAVGDVSTLI